MIFESLWPLLFLAAVPVIIILYLLKPKGTDYLISSSLLWKKLLKNEQSRTFFEKFVHNILMYLQILIIALLVIALMSPFIQADGQGGGRKILLFDTSASMQHMADGSANQGKTRLEEAVLQACDYVRTAQNTRFSILTTDDTGAKLLAVDIADEGSLVQTLQGIVCSDSGGSLEQAQELLDTLAGVGTENVVADNAADVIVYTDGQGASGFDRLHSMAGKELHVMGAAVGNVANEYTVFTRREDGYYDVMVSVANYSDAAVTFDVSLYDGGGQGSKLLALKQMQLAPSASNYCLFEEVHWQGETMESRIDGISFAGGTADSLVADNVSYAVKGSKNRMKGLLVGEGNTFIEKAYLAVTGESIAKAKTDAVVEETGIGKRTPFSEMDYNIIIYDAGQQPSAADINRLIFGNAGNASSETLENVVLDIADCDLTAGLSGFTIGVNKAYCFAVPEGAKSFLEHDGKCVGYYMEQDGIREIVVGFDIRESDFPLRAEFPVFLANVMIYLSDTSWLASNVYYAGEEIALQPWAELDRSQFDSRPAKAGLYQLGNEDYQEQYIVRFCTPTESDGRGVAASTQSTSTTQRQKVKQTIRNLFLLLALALLVAEWIVYVRQMRYKGRFYLVVRGIVFLCVLLALFGLKIRLGNSQTATVFVVDLSDSNEEHLEEAKDYLQKTISQMPAGNVHGIVTFGKNAVVEQFLTAERHFGGIMTLPEKTATNFEDAISRALTLASGDYSKRLVVLTDGKETRGDIQGMAQALAASHAEFLTLLYENEETPDAYVGNVLLPSYLHPGDKYSVTVVVESNYDTDAVVTLYNGSRQMAANKVHLDKGSSRFVFEAQVDAGAESGMMENLRVQVRAEGDTCQENDFFNAYSVVETPPRILVISSRDSNIAGFASVLKAAGCDYSLVSTRNAPDNINDMLDYKSIILVDTYIDDLPSGFLENLETYVKDYGCGFVCCGGENSFALGGYRDTVLETVLPVDMQLRSMNELPSMAMVMVIDRSGSMTGQAGALGASNLDVAIRAATVAVDNLQDTDYVGVLTFDDKFSWQVELRQADDKAAIKEEIKKISDGGGTTIKPSLREAGRVLSESDVSVKHVVLLTDGMGETSNFNDVIDVYTDNKITLSTVAVGSGADKTLLKRLADKCGGRYYYSDESSDIPRIFAQEVFLGGDSYIQNGVFSLSVQTGHELTNSLFSGGWPVVYGYIAATPKTASSPVIAAGEKADPVLTVWQYGLGRTVAWNSDVMGEWMGAFAGQEDYVQLWKRIADYSTGNANMGEDSVNVVTAGEQTTVDYQTDDYGSTTGIEVTMIDPDGNTTEEKLHAAAPGKYTIDLPTSQAGLYHFNIRRMEDGQIQNYMTTAAAVQFSDEYKFDVTADSYLRFVEQYGKLITKEDPVWTRISTGAREGYPLTNWLLALAVILFLADVAMRRFQYQPKWTIMKGRTRRQNMKNEPQAARQQGEPETEDASETKNEKPVENKERKQKKARKTKQAEQTLDTSQLLKKKDDRGGK